MARKYNETTAKAVEEEMISLAIEQARTQLKNGTAPASTVNFYLKMASSRERIERELIDNQVSLLQAKVDNIKNNEGEAQAYREAIDAIKSYGYNKVN